MTERTHEGGRLFPPEEFTTGWRLSAQADRFGYRCRPAEALRFLEDYDAVEVVIYDRKGTVDPTDIGLPVEIAQKFDVTRDEETGAVETAIGRFITHHELNLIRAHLASRSPTAPTE